VREYNPNVDQALRAEAARRELRRVLRWPTVAVGHESPDSTCRPVRRTCGASSATGHSRCVVRITRVVRQRTVVTETVPERPIREEAARERYKGLVWVSLGLAGGYGRDGGSGTPGDGARRHGDDALESGGCVSRRPTNRMGSEAPGRRSGRWRGWYGGWACAIWCMPAVWLICCGWGGGYDDDDDDHRGA